MVLQPFRVGPEVKKTEYAVVIPNRYHDILVPLVGSIHHHTPIDEMPRMVIVGHGHTRLYAGFETIRYGFPTFTFPLSANQGMRAVAPADVFLINDDTRLIQDSTFERLAMIAAADPQIGILSPLLKGCAGNPIQRWHERGLYWYEGEHLKVQVGEMPVCFPFVWLRRKMLDEIGLLNEAIVGYGFDDNQMCNAARLAGWKTAVTSEVVVQHGDGGPELGEGRGKTWSLSFARRDLEQGRG